MPTPSHRPIPRTSDAVKMFVFFLRDRISLAVGMTLSGLGYALFEMINIGAVLPVVNSVLSEGTPARDYGRIIRAIQQLIDLLPTENLFVASMVFLIGTTFMKSGLNLLFTYVSNKFSQVSRRDIQDRIYRKYIDSDYQFFADTKQGVLMYRLLNAPATISTTLKLIPDIAIQSLKIIVLLILLFSISPMSATGMMGVGLFFGLFVKRLSNLSYRFGQEIAQTLSDQTSIVNETLSGIRQIRIYQSESRWIRSFFEKINTYFLYKLRAQIFNAAPIIVLEPLIILAIGLAGIFIKLRFKGDFTNLLPMLAMYAFAIIRINPALSAIGQQRMLVMNNLPDMEICYNALNEKTRKILDGELYHSKLKDAIIFKDVNFSYPGRGQILNRINIEMKKGQTTAIVGVSGSGKSTIINLLVRLYDPTDGAVRIDGMDLKRLKLSSWLNTIGYVSQDTFIFNATITENISDGDDGFKLSDIVEAAKIANADGFITDFPDGYETIVGDRGAKLSGGQKQRIAIAAAIIRKPDIIIFDEATSALDTVSEKLVQDAIENISRKYTAVIVAHRLSTVRNADQIIVIDKGTVVESGTHTELISRMGVYWSLHNQLLDIEAKKAICTDDETTTETSGYGSI
jgi:ATP-binding cassette, subfamily B, bacterial MsbA